MSADGAVLRIALLSHDYGAEARSNAGLAAGELARGLAELGHKATVIACHRGPRPRSVEDGVEVVRVRRLTEAPLRARGFAGPLTQIPFTVAALRNAGFDLAHAFSAVDSQSALLWRRISGRPVVFTCAEPPRREDLSDRRCRLPITARAYRASDAVTAASVGAQAAIGRLLALDIPVLEPGDAEAYEALYRECLARSSNAPSAQT